MFETTVGSRRAARIAFGTVLIAGAAALIIDVTHPLAARGKLDSDHAPIPTMWIMIGSWVLAFVIGAFVQRLRIGALFGEPRRDHALGGTLPVGARRPTSAHLLTASLVVPSVGVALMLPLLLHLPFLITSETSAYDSWVALSMAAVGLAHLVLAVMMGIRAWRLAHGKQPPSIGLVYFVGIAAACWPYGMFLLPPILAAITGLPFISLMHHQEVLARRERDDEQLDVIPAAIAHFRALI